ncbi:MAG TPA: cob(I)yrinic acid a,c-diamide adenosyltransferase [Candidatus Choladocola avistercoris]|nr:cob(I)yrinic acid a,c-diamide adenosyltransferase [Candidatus Choladocola avistercoris]
MKRGTLQIYFGSGRGKTTAALGQAIKEASRGRSVFIVQFLKGRQPEEIQFIQRLEPEIKLFRFQRREKAFVDLDPQERAEETMNMKNGLGFARKVLATGECDVLILDEILGLVEYGIASADDIRALLGEASEGTEIIFTGQNLCREIMDLADFVYQITTLKEQGCCAKEDAKEEGYGNI